MVIREMGLLLMPNWADRDLDLIQWPPFLLASKVSNIWNDVFSWICMGILDVANMGGQDLGRLGSASNFKHIPFDISLNVSGSPENTFLLKNHLFH